MTAKRPIAYISAAWSGNRTADRERAALYCRQVYEAGYSPICPRGTPGAGGQEPLQRPFGKLLGLWGAHRGHGQAQRRRLAQA